MVAKPQNLKTWLADECRFSGSVIAQRTCYDGRVRLGVYPIGHAVQSEALHTLGSLHGAVQLSSGRPISSVTIKTGWQAGKQEFGGPEITYDHPEFEAFSRTEHLDIEVMGLAWPWESAGDQAGEVAMRILARELEPGQQLLLHAGAAALNLVPGETVAITVAGIPTDEGTLGYVARAATVLGVKWCGYHPTQRWQAQVHVRVGSPHRISTYCPCARVIAYEAGPPVVITVSLNEFSSDDAPNPWGERPTRDYTWFRPGFSIGIWTEGNWGATYDIRTITSVLNDDLTLDDEIDPAPGANCFITYCPYAYAHADQKRFVYIADGAPPTLGAAEDDPFLYAVR